MFNFAIKSQVTNNNSQNNQQRRFTDINPVHEIKQRTDTHESKDDSKIYNNNNLLIDFSSDIGGGQGNSQNEFNSKVDNSKMNPMDIISGIDFNAISNLNTVPQQSKTNNDIFVDFSSQPNTSQNNVQNINYNLSGNNQQNNGFNFQNNQQNIFNTQQPNFPNNFNNQQNNFQNSQFNYNQNFNTQGNYGNVNDINNFNKMNNLNNQQQNFNTQNNQNYPQFQNISYNNSTNVTNSKPNTVKDPFADIFG